MSVDVVDVLRIEWASFTPAASRAPRPAVVVAVGRPERVRCRGMARHFTEDGRPRALACSSSSSSSMPAPSPITKPSRLLVERAARPRRLVVPRRHRRQQDEARDAEGMNHAVHAAGKHHIGAAAANDLDCSRQSLGAGRASRQARQVRAPAPKHARDMACGRSRLLLGFVEPIEHAHPKPGEESRIHLAAGVAAVDQIDDSREILLAFTGSKVHAEPRRISALVIEQPRLRDCLRRRRQREWRCADGSSTVRCFLPGSDPAAGP